MGYYVRVLTPNDRIVTVTRLRSALANEGLSADLKIEEGDDQDWTQLVLSHAKGDEIAAIERNEVAAGTLGRDEIDEFIEETRGGHPAVNAKWLGQYLKRVKVIYSFQVLNGSEATGGWDALGAVKSEIWSALGGIFQADLEGFSNEKGYHILWQFSKGVSGSWCMALLNQDGSWTNFQMELGNLHQRESFLAGKLPKGAKLL